MAGRAVLLYGGSFNPIHHGHLIVARSAAEHLGAVRTILIPSASPPHKSGSELAAPEQRLEMARLAVADEPGFEVSDTEIRRTGPSYTILTVGEYRQRLGAEVPVYWLIGGDTLPELGTWYRVSELVELCAIVTAGRPGYEQPDLSTLFSCLSAGQIARLREGILPTPQVDISATDIRRRVREGQSFRYLVPDSVRQYIQGRGIYRA
jgi:nicotinate-nucleotide adenylyltransferase